LFPRLTGSTFMSATSCLQRDPRNDEMRLMTIKASGFYLYYYFNKH
jgi:hypothetical protein